MKRKILYVLAVLALLTAVTMPVFGQYIAHFCQYDPVANDCVGLSGDCECTLFYYPELP